MNKEEKEAIEFLKEKMENWRKYMPEDTEPHAEDIILNLIQKQEKIIDKMAEKLYFDCFDRVCQECCKECEKDKDTQRECIKEYFKKEVEKE